MANYANRDANTMPYSAVNFMQGLGAGSVGVLRQIILVSIAHYFLLQGYTVSLKNPFLKTVMKK